MLGLGSGSGVWDQVQVFIDELESSVFFFYY